MNLLLDTHVLLWAAGASPRLPDDARALLEDPGNKLFFSAASLWEIAIKNRLGREEFSVDPRLLRRGLLENGYVELAVTGAHAVNVDLLPPIHKDPFDRILVAQAQVEGITLLTVDEVVTRYPGPIRTLGGHSLIG
ncbi:MAG: type II toxin-antitoxin system VapC family toxin [Bryobacterales bacterium]|nr:type II toxin-antitoxin system VapC family toxin [Bryobacterales bacterium]